MNRKTTDIVFFSGTGGTDFLVLMYPVYASNAPEPVISGWAQEDIWRR